MEKWTDQGIVLSARLHGEGGAVVTLLTAERGRHAGYVHGGRSSRMRGVIEPGCLVNAQWSAPVADQLGSYALEQERNPASLFMTDPLRLGALLAACGLCDAALPEREAHPGLYHGFLSLLDALDSDIWGAVYVMWEIALLRELGFALDLTRCAGGGDAETLCWVSPKSGHAVSAEKGAAYRDRLLSLPVFLRPAGAAAIAAAEGRVAGDGRDVLDGLRLTGYFLEHWVFTHRHGGVPPERLRFQERFARYVEESGDENPYPSGAASRGHATD